MADDDELLTAQQVADMLKVSTESIRRWTRTGELVATRFGHRTIRYRHADVERFIRQQRKGDP